MNFSVARLRAFLGSLFSSHAAQRKLLVLALLVQGACATGYLIFERNWIEADVIQSLKNVSAMHQRSFDQLETTLGYQLTLIGKSMQDIEDGKTEPLALHAVLHKEVNQVWLDSVTVLDPDGNIVNIDSKVPLALAQQLSVQATRSFRDLPEYRAFRDSGAESTSFLVSRPNTPVLGGGGLVTYRRVTSVDGSPLGMVVAFSSLRSLSALLNADTVRGLDLGKDGLLDFIDQHSHKLLYRYLYNGEPAAMNTLPSQVISPSSFQDTGYGTDVKFYRSPVDGLERLSVLSQMHHGQWLQVVGASKDAYLFNWRIQVIFSVLAFAGIGVLQWLLLGFFQRNNQQRTFLDLVLDSVDACVYFKTSERYFAYVNAKTAALFGLSAEQIIGRRDSDVLPQNIADDFWATDNQVLTSGSKHSCTEIFVNKQGETRYYSSVKVPVQLPGQLPALVGISTDVTELQKQTLARAAAEKTLAAHNHSLWLNNQVLEKLGQNATLPEVFDAMLRIIDNYRPGMSGAVFLVSDNGRDLTGCSAPNLPEAWLEVTARLPIAEMNGASTAAARSGETVIVEDVSTHPCWAAAREKTLSLGLRAAWAQPIKNSEGKILGIFTLYKHEPAEPDDHDLVLLADYARIAQMVIERARLAGALQESQALYRLIAENNNDMIWVMEYPFLSCSYVSPSAERMRGWTPEEIRDQPFEDMVSLDSVHLVQETLQDCMRRIDVGDLTGRFFTMELEHLHKDGHVFPVETRGTIMLDSDGRPTHIIGSTRDITQRKAAEDALHQAREELANQLLLAQTLINAIPSPVFAKDRAGRYLMCNKAFEDYCGRPREEILGKDGFDLWPREMAQAWFEADNSVFNNPHAQAYDAKVLHSDGTQRDVVLNNAIFCDSHSKVAGMIGVAMDITERKAAEEATRTMALFDQLTGLPNRRMMEDQLDQMLTVAKREHRKLSLLFVDLDRFKAVNDQHGHKTGDWLLVQVASRMRSVLRATDIASRFGGDEFVILLPDAHRTEDAVLVAEKIRAELEKTFVMENGVELEISSSIGVAMYPGQAENVRDLLHSGDEAMYCAKNNGRNAVEVFGSPARKQ